MQQRVIGILALAALIALSACGGGGSTSTLAPTNIRTQSGDGYVTVTWDFSGNASTFEIYRETIGGASLGAQALEKIDTLEDGSARTYEDISVDSSATYSYGVSANGGEVVPTGGSGVSPEPGNVLRVLFGGAVPPDGLVTSDPAGISCEEPGQPGCEAEFAAIADVTLSAAPVPGLAVTWENCPGAGPNAPCVVDMLTDKTVTVTYTTATTLTLDVEPAGTAVVTNLNDLGTNPDIDCSNNCTYFYPEDLIIGLTAQSLDPDNYELEAWGGACSESSGTTCTVTMDGSQSASVDFRLIPPTASLTALGSPRITTGESATLEWNVLGGGDLATGELEITITPEIGPVDSRMGIVEVTPDVTREYTLTATNASGTATDVQTVVVGNGALVESFAASPAAINPGESSTLSWTITGTDTAESPMTVMLQPLGVDVSDVDQYDVSPNATMEYTLVASNEFGFNQETTTVRVGAPPSIEAFAAADAFINPGDQTSLNWEVIGPGDVSLSIAPVVGDVTDASTAFVEPAVTTTYTLTATSEFGMDTAQTKVSVGEAPAITTFDAADKFITPDESTTLSWVVTGDGDIALTLDPGGTVSEPTREVVSPDVTTTFELTASSEFGEASSTVTVNVGVAPSITEFFASDATITSSQMTTLSWDVLGTDSAEFPMTVTLSPGGVVSGQEATVGPDVDTVYTLTAENAFGEDTATTGVTVEPAVAAIAPTATSCDGVAVSGECDVTISLLNTSSAYEGAQFELSSDAFDLKGASTASETSGCFVESGDSAIVVACQTRFGEGDIALVTVSRTDPTASTFVTRNTRVAPDDTGTIEVDGDSLAVAAAD